MAIVDQIQDKNNVTRDIVDKGLNEKTAATAIASSDYVLLEDTSGAYHKIAKASFTEAVRSALGSVINGVAKGTDIAKVPVLDANNDLGMGTLANLASVLGANMGVMRMTAGSEHSFTGVFFVGNDSSGWSLYSHNKNGTNALCGIDMSGGFTTSNLKITIKSGYSGYYISI